MANEQTQRVITVEITVQLPREHAYTDSELVDTLKIKSEYKEIKVKYFGIADPEPA